MLPAWWIFVACATHFPRLRSSLGLHNEDKMYHLLGFAPLAYFYWRFFETFGARSARFVYGAAFVLAAYAAVDEYTQVYFDRGREFADWATGVGAMWLVLGVLEWQRRRRGCRPAR